MLSFSPAGCFIPYFASCAMNCGMSGPSLEPVGEYGIFCTHIVIRTPQDNTRVLYIDFGLPLCGKLVYEEVVELVTITIFLTASANRLFGRVHSTFKSLRNMRIKWYEILYESYIDSIMNSASDVWGFGNFEAPRVLQNRIMRVYLGVYRYASVAATKLEMDCIECREKRWLNMLRLFISKVKLCTFEVGRLINNFIHVKINIKR